MTFWSWSPRLLRIFGIDVRVHWISIVIYAMLLIQYAQQGVLGLGAGVVGAMILIVLLHEFGHALMARSLGVPVHEIVLWPLGGLTRMGDAYGSPRGEIMIALAGPLMNLLIGAGLLAPLAMNGVDLGWASLNPFQIHFESFARAPFWYLIFHWNAIILLLNLLPLYPLDGGAALYAWLALRTTGYRALIVSSTLGIVGGAALLVYSLFSFDRLLPFVAVTILFVNIERRREAAFRYFGDFTYEPPPGPRQGFFSRWIQKRRESKRRREEEERRNLRSRVDQILDKVNQVGLSGLTEEERSFLQEASKRLRETEE